MRKTDNIRGRLYRWFTSLRTSVYLFALLTVFYIVGTIFPQGVDTESYRQAGGRFIGAVELLGLLDIFHTPLFYLVAILLLVNLTVCTWERFQGVRRRAWRESPDVERTYSFALSCQETEEVLEEFMKKNRFRPVSRDEATITVEKGIYYRYLTLLYHAGIVVCFVGFFLTGFFVKEGLLVLKPGEPVAIESRMMPEIRGWLAKEGPPPFSIQLDEFRTEYILSRKLNYPEDGLSRLAMALGWQDITYTDEERYYPKDWFSSLRILDGGTTAVEKTIQVNDPLRYRGYTFYQVGFEERLKLKMDDKVFTVTTNKKKKIDELDRTIIFTGFRRGTLFRPDGTVEELHPFVTIKELTEDGKKRPVGRLHLGESIEIGGKSLYFEGFEETSILSYRYDPGVWLLWYAGFSVFGLMALRCLGRWYMLRFRIEKKEGRTLLTVRIHSRGLMADAQRVSGLLSAHLERFTG